MRLEISLLLVLMVSMGCSKNTEEVDLKLVKNVGDQTSIVYNTKTEQGVLVSVDNTTEMTLKVDKIDGRIYSMSADVTRKKYEMLVNGEGDKYDSEKDVNTMNDAEREIHESNQSTMDGTFSILIDDKGNIMRDFYNIDDPSEEVSFINMLDVQIPFPAEKIKVGSTWTAESTIAPLNNTVTSTFKVTDITDDEIEISLKKESVLLQSMDVNLNGSGEYVLNRQTGSLISAKISTKLYGGGTLKQNIYTK